MKKLRLLSMPLMVVSLLSSCGGGNKPGITITVDAGDGNISGLKKVTHIANKGDKLVPFLRSLSPIKQDSVFGYFSIKDSDKVIDYEDTVTESIEINSNYFSAQIEDLDQDYLTWDVIKAIAVTNNTPNSCFKLGATKTVKVNDLNHQVRIIGFNHDDLVSGNGKAGITFDFVNVISIPGAEKNKPLQVNWDITSGTSSTSYNFPGSTLNNILNKGEDCVFNKFPDDLKSVIKEVNKFSAITSDYKIDSYNTKLFPLAMAEVWPEQEEYVPLDGSPYPYWKTHVQRIDRYKKVVGSNDPTRWWLRSPKTNLNNIAWHVGPDGGFTGTYVYGYTRNVAPAFCI